MKSEKAIQGDKLLEYMICVILGLACITALYPLILVLSSSFSDPFAVMKNEVKLWPVRPTVKIYMMIFKNTEIWTSYKNTIIYTLVGTSLNVFLTTVGAYPLSRRDFFGRKVITPMFVFTMFFSVGMMPVYILVRSLGLYNTMWAILLPGAVSTYNLIIMITYFGNNIPMEIQEAAHIDGENDLGLLFRIVLPLSAPILAVMILFYGVGQWNSWFPALLYISSRAKYPLQMVLREIILQGSTSDMSGASVMDQELIGEGIKHATMIVATLPILCLYPFLQKYFVKGVMVGAIKG